jgi:hypothetical protein
VINKFAEHNGLIQGTFYSKSAEIFSSLFEFW